MTNSQQTYDFIMLDGVAFPPKCNAFELLDSDVERMPKVTLEQVKTMSDAAYDKHIRPIVDEMLDELDREEAWENFVGGW